MNFRDEMKKVFLKVIAGEVEPAEWKNWWDSHIKELEAVLDRGDLGHIMPAEWSVSYHWMVRTQSGVAYHFYRQGRPMKTSDYYEKKRRKRKSA